MLTTILVCILAGLGAGLGTGFAGMSAAAVISPMLITFLAWNLTRPSGSLSPVMCWPVLSPLMNMEKTKTWISKTGL